MAALSWDRKLWGKTDTLLDQLHGSKAMRHGALTAAPAEGFLAPVGARLSP